MSKQIIKENILSKFKPYKKDMDYTYTLGAFPTIELIKSKPEIVQTVYVHTKYTQKAEIETLCSQNNIQTATDDSFFQRVCDKDNCYVIGVFNKFICNLEKSKPHVVLVNPSDMGNLGTIIRTLVGVGILDLAVITPCADIFHPKTVRSSMGALFKLRIQNFSSFEEYHKIFRQHEYFPFMLNGGKTLSIANCPKSKLYSLIFGNEAEGLSQLYNEQGTSIFIPQTNQVDSLNLPIAVGIAAFIFTSSNGQQKNDECELLH